MDEFQRMLRQESQNMSDGAGGVGFKHYFNDKGIEVGLGLDEKTMRSHLIHQS